MSSKPVTRSASKSKGKTTAHEADATSPTPKSIHARRRKSAPAVTEADVVGNVTDEDVKGKTKEKSSDKAGHVLGLKLDGLKEKLGEGLGDLTVKLHPTVSTHDSQSRTHADGEEFVLQGNGHYKLLGKCGASTVRRFLTCLVLSSRNAPTRTRPQRRSCIQSN